MPVGNTLWPSSAFTNVDLPWLNSPRTTTWNRSPSSLGIRLTRRSRARVVMPTASAMSASARYRSSTAALAVLWISLSMMSLEDREQIGDLLVDVVGAGPARRIAAGDLNVERAVGEPAERGDALGQERVRAEQLPDGA